MLKLRASHDDAALALAHGGHDGKGKVAAVVVQFCAGHADAGFGLVGHCGASASRRSFLASIFKSMGEILVVFNGSERR